MIVSSIDIYDGYLRSNEQLINNMHNLDERQSSVDELIQGYIESLSSPVSLHHFKKLGFSEYVDRQLKHLVIQEKFSFDKISELLIEMFPEFDKKLSKQNCAERWTQMHVNRKYKLNEKQNKKNDKRLVSIMAFQDPKRMFTAGEFILELEKQQQKRESKPKKENQILKQNKGFNIIKDSIKKRDEFEYQQLEVQFLKALEKAKIVDEQMCEKPFLYRPKFICDNQYELQKQDLTQQKVHQILSQSLQINNTVVGEFKTTIQIPDYKSKFKQDKQDSRFGVIEDDWSDYESDDETDH